MTYQERVIAEKAELDQRLTRLRAFLTSDTFNTVSEPEQDLLYRQVGVMAQYSRILSERISQFKVSTTAAVSALQNYLHVLETNEPINRVQGDTEQADLQARCAAEVRQALAIIQASGEAREPVAEAQKRMAEDREIHEAQGQATLAFKHAQQPIPHDRIR